MLSTTASTPAEGHSSFEIPAELERSPLLAAGGYRVISGLIGEAQIQGLLSEAESGRSAAKRTVLLASDGTEYRGGSPGRAFRSAPGGGLHWDLHACEPMLAAVSALCGVPVVPLGGGTYTFYEKEGDFLALHRDVIKCDVALITCLSLTGSNTSGGALHVYPRYLNQPLSIVRAAGPDAGCGAPLARGETVVLFGGILPHEVTPMSAGKERIVSVMCYRTLIRETS